jgi:hypothetical protein
MEAAPDEYRLEDIASPHRIAASLFLPFAVARLRGDPGATEAILTVLLRGIVGPGEAQQKLRVLWSAESGTTQPLGVQESVITEWAALGVACAVLSRYAGVWIRTVAAPGDSFDYWVTDGRWQYGLEVSGTMTEELEARHREKIRQLRDNPYGLDGYVMTVGFTPRTVILSFNHFAGNES